MPTYLRRALAAAALCALLSNATPASAADPYDIDVVLSLTGPGAFIGKAEQVSLNAYERSANQHGGIAGRPIRFVIHDDQTSPQQAVSLMNDVIAKKTPVVLGGTLAATCLAMAPLAKTGPVQYCLSPAIHPAAGSYVFSASVSTKDFAVSFYRYFRAKGLKNVALIASTDASGQDADEAFESALQLPENKNSGLTLVAHEHFNVTDLSVAAQMARLKAANPQVVVCYAPGTPFGTLLRGVQQAGIDVPIATGNANMTYAQMKQYADILPRELIFPGMPVLGGGPASKAARTSYNEFMDAMRASEVTPDLLNTIAWDPAALVVSALRKFGTAMTADQLRTYLLGLHDWAGVNGPYDFTNGSQRGLDVSNLEIMRWDAQKNAWTAVSGLGGYVGGQKS